MREHKERMSLCSSLLLFVSPVGSVSLFSCSQNCLHFCTQLSQCRPHKNKFITIFIHVCTCAFLLPSLYTFTTHIFFLDPFIKNNLSGHDADQKNTVLLRQMRSLALWPKLLLPQKSFRWILGCEWMGYLVLIYGMWRWKCYGRRLFAKSQMRPQTKGKCGAIVACGLRRHKRTLFSR